jgi:subfamily B ATP-binding cassette protein MsbA
MTNDSEPRRKRKKDKSVSSFWRACRFLYPYRRIVTVSILCALFVGAAFTGGLSTMLPIMQVLLKGTTIQEWAQQQIVERRIGVEFSDQVDDLVIIRVKPNSPAVRAPLKPGQSLLAFGKGRDERRAALRDLSSDATSYAAIALPPLDSRWRAARDIADRMPVNPIAAIAAVFGVIATLAVVSNVLSFFQEYYSDKAAILAVQDIRRRTYDHVLHVPMSHFGSRGTSDVTSRLTQDTQELATGFKTVLGQSIQEPIKAAFAFGLALYVSWQLTLFIVLFGPIMLAIIKKLGTKMRRASRAALVSSSSMLGQIEGTLTGIRVVKGASAERFERRRYTRIMDKLVDEQLRMSRIDAFSQPTIQTLTLFVVGAVVLIASYMVLISKSLEATSFILVMACLAGIGDSLRRLSKVNNVLQKANAAAVRIFEVLDLPIERERHEGTVATPRRRINLPRLQREIRFENLTFSYPNANTTALNDVSLVVPKGRSVAVVGRNGSGKTTLLALLPRFFDPQQGRVLLDGIDIKDATLRSLRGQISIVTQDSVIFPGTIAENIAYGHPLAAHLQGDSPIAKELMADVERAARKAFAHDFILEKPQGYNTLLGEMGGQLSGGQKQRVCIARAIFRHAPILVLDEATSQVDAESEHLIQQAIDKLMKDADEKVGRPTTFVIAHRFSTILSADTIVVMDRGRIVGQGRHDELLRTCETYQQLYERQLIAAPAA